MLSNTSIGKVASGRYRWTICAMMFFATTINYMDRQMLGLLAPLLQKDIGSDSSAVRTDGNDLHSDLCDRPSGVRTYSRQDCRKRRVRHRNGVVERRGDASCVPTVPGFAAARGLLGFSEASNFPVAIRTTALWFPKEERALATSIWNMGATVGGLVAPAFVPFVAVMWGWRAAFVVGGAAGFIWLVFWMVMYRPAKSHPRVSEEELNYINADLGDTVQEDKKVGWLSVLRYRETWAFMVGKFMTDPIWWFYYLFWLPKWLNESNHIDIQHMGLPLMVIYGMSCIGSVAAGWMSSRLMARTQRANFARKATMLVCALCVMPIALVSQFQSLWFAVFTVGLAAAAHQVLVRKPGHARSCSHLRAARRQTRWRQR
ncbi:MFS transporter [Candidatus Burkholderia verschuerenii]|uniref:MFS transporter n=1 Tax=Candidatus Burkholderia verschuerenii TaxID=242163 RepID=UPI000A61D8C5